MRKRVFGRKLKRTTNQRKALFKSLTQALVLHGRIKTTEAKAKSIKGEVEKLITHANKNEANAFHYLQRHVHVKTAEGIIKIAPVFKGRPGGYTRIIKIGNRIKDSAPMVILEFVEKTDSSVVEEPKKIKKIAKEAIVKKSAVVKAKTVKAKKIAKKE